ncbi:uncharacterized protein LOC105013439 [Esox lucius]|uniref:uncharacterized protein LOC105013439 n=1 Tax=Esox lucius TaxID=8010 RepID=UPI00147768D2|nr:uncharacterized protein LOC105013439 [Esox lucius]
MATDPRASPKSPVSQDNGLWMDAGCKLAEDTDRAKGHSSFSEEKSHEVRQDVIPPPCVTTSNPNGMEEDDEVFILPPPCTDPFCPGEGGTTQTNINVSVEANSVIEAKENPRSLDGVHAEQLQSPVVDKTTVTAEEEQITGPKSRGSMDIPVLTEEPGPASVTEVDRWKEAGARSPGPSHRNVDLGIQEDTDSTPDSEPERFLGDDEATVTAPGRTDESSGDAESMDDDTLLNCVAREHWVRRDSAGADGQPRLSISRGLSGEQMTAPWPQSPASEGQEQEDVDNLTVAEDIQQGEKLLLRLHLVQQRHDGHAAQEPPPSYQAATKTGSQDTGCQEVELIEGVTEEKEEQGGREETRGERELGESVQLQTILVEEAATLFSEIQTCPLAQLRKERECTDDDQSDSGVSTDFGPVGNHDIHTSTTPIINSRAPPPQNERDIPSAVERRPSLQRSMDVANTQEGPEVLDIALMKTSLLGKTLSSKTAGQGPGRGTDWQFSKKKMQKEISQEIQRELVLVNLGKIPGVYSKGTVRQMRERKLLFEAFQQGNAEGAAKHSRPPSTAGLGKGHVFPSVLERTRSLELVSLKACSLSRTHSHQLFDIKAMQGGSGQTLTVESQHAGTGTEQHLVILESDDTVVAHYPNKDSRAQRLCRSLECLSVGGNTFSEEAATDEMSGAGPRDQGSAILRENPFYKLRPSLAMKPEVEKDIREARKREEELRRQRCSLYGVAGASGGRQDSSDDLTLDSSAKLTPSTSSLTTSADGRQTKGKLDRTWPPPDPKHVEDNPGQTQETKVFKAGGQKTPLWQRWEAGMVSGPQPRKQD